MYVWSFCETVEINGSTMQHNLSVLRIVILLCLMYTKTPLLWNWMISIYANTISFTTVTCMTNVYIKNTAMSHALACPHSEYTQTTVRLSTQNIILVLPSILDQVYRIQYRVFFTWYRVNRFQGITPPSLWILFSDCRSSLHSNCVIFISSFQK